jgi:dephospho-CoA kinase
MKLGVTGGIGAGKTTVCRIFNVLGIPVFSADIEARIIMETDQNVIRKINALTGKDLFLNGSLDRKGLAKLIFTNKNLLEQVNNVVHPVVLNQFLIWTEKQYTPYVILEAAILFESNASKLVDKIITVIAPEEERVERVIQRNDLTREQVMERMQNQMHDEERLIQSDYVIDNSENQMIIPLILKIHDDILNKIQSKKQGWEIL